MKLRKSIFKAALLAGIISLLVIALSLPTLAAHALPAFARVQESAPADPFGDLFTTFKTLTGVAALIAALVGVGKRIGIVQDGTAPAWSTGLNIVGLIALFVLQLFGKADMVPGLDTQAGSLANVITVILAFVYQLFASRVTYENALAGIPVIGHSHSGRLAGSDGLVIDVGEDME
jgi:hypothetical protein